MTNDCNAKLRAFFEQAFPDALRNPSAGFMSLGADSLDLETWALELAKVLGVDDGVISALTFTEHPSLNELTEYVAEELGDDDDDVGNADNADISDDEARTSPPPPQRRWETLDGTETRPMEDDCDMPRLGSPKAAAAPRVTTSTAASDAVNACFADVLPSALKKPDTPFGALVETPPAPLSKWALELARALKAHRVAILEPLDETTIRKHNTLNALHAYVESRVVQQQMVNDVLLHCPSDVHATAPAGPDDDGNNNNEAEKCIRGGAPLRCALRRRGVTLTPLLLAFLDLGVFEHLTEDAWRSLPSHETLSRDSSVGLDEDALDAGMVAFATLGWIHKRADADTGVVQYRLSASFPAADVFGDDAALGSGVAALFFRSKAAELLVAYAAALASADEMFLDWAVRLVRDAALALRRFDECLAKELGDARPRAPTALTHFGIAAHAARIRDPTLRELVMGALATPLLVILKATEKCSSTAHVTQEKFAGLLPFSFPGPMATQSVQGFLDMTQSGDEVCTAHSLLEGAGVCSRMCGASLVRLTLVCGAKAAFTTFGKYSWARALDACEEVANLPNVLLRCALASQGVHGRKWGKWTPLHALGHHCSHYVALKAYSSGTHGNAFMVSDQMLLRESAKMPPFPYALPWLESANWGMRFAPPAGCFALRHDGSVIDPLSLGVGLVRHFARWREAFEHCAQGFRDEGYPVIAAHSGAYVTHAENEGCAHVPHEVDRALQGAVNVDVPTYLACAMVSGLFPKGLRFDLYPLPSMMLSPRSGMHLSCTRFVMHGSLALRFLRDDDDVAVEVSPKHLDAARRYLPDLPNEATAADRAFVVHAPVLAVARFWEFIHWGDEAMCTPEEVVKSRFAKHPGGQYGLVDMDTGKVLAMLFTQRIDSPRMYQREDSGGHEQARWATKEDYHTKGGKYVQLLDIFSAKSDGLATNVVRDAHIDGGGAAFGVGSYLRHVAKLLLTWTEDVEAVFAVTRCRDYLRQAEGASYASYVAEVAAGRKRDTGLNFHLDGGAELVCAVPDWRPADVVNAGHGALIRYSK